MHAFIAFTRPLAALSLVVAAQAGAAPLGYYVATPVATPAKNSLMTHDTPWRVQGAAYTADRAPERAELLCQLVAQRVGQLSAFSAAGTSFDADALAKCNARAKPARATAVAAR